MSHTVIRQPTYDVNVRPFMIIWETTHACDLACRHCRAQAIPEHDPLSLNFEEAKRLLEQVESFGKPRPIFIFTGGDPFKRVDLFDLLNYGNELGLAMAVSPSGTPLLNEANLRRIKEHGGKAISLSIDGSTPERHDDFRQVPGSFDLTTRGWQTARSIGLKLQLNTTVTRYNLDDLPNIFRLVLDYGAMTWSLFFLVPTGRGKAEDEVSPAEYEAVMHFLYDCSKYISAKTTEGHHYKRVVLQRSILDEKGLPLEDYFELHPVYYQLRAAMEKIVAEYNLQPKDNIVRTPMHINAGNGFVFISRRGDVFHLRPAHGVEHVLAGHGSVEDAVGVGEHHEGDAQHAQVAFDFAHVARLDPARNHGQVLTLGLAGLDQVANDALDHVGVARHVGAHVAGGVAVDDQLAVGVIDPNPLVMPTVE